MSRILNWMHNLLSNATQSTFCVHLEYWKYWSNGGTRACSFSTASMMKRGKIYRKKCNRKIAIAFEALWVERAVFEQCARLTHVCKANLDSVSHCVNLDGRLLQRRTESNAFVLSQSEHTRCEPTSLFAARSATFDVRKFGQRAVKWVGSLEPRLEMRPKCAHWNSTPLEPIWTRGEYK